MLATRTHYPTLDSVHTRLTPHLAARALSSLHARCYSLSHWLSYNGGRT